MLELRKIWHTGLVLLGGALILLAVITQSQTNATGGGGGQCSPEGAVVKPVEDSVVDGFQNFEAVFPITHNVINVQFILDGDILGDADPINATLWRMPFNTTLLPDDEYDLKAKAFRGGGAGVCHSPEISFSTDNGTNSSGSIDLELFVVPEEEWFGPTNVNVNFDASAYLADTLDDVSDDAVFNWSTTIGSISPNGRFATFSSGPNPGAGEVKVIAHYAGESENATIDVNILNPENTSTYPTIGDPENPFPDDEDIDFVESDDPEVQAEQRKKIRKLTFGDPALASCLASEFGREDYKNLINSEDRLSFQELTRSSPCFGGLRFVIPANLAPVDPDHIRNLREDNKLANLDKIIESEDEFGETRGLVLSGMTNPNATILIYVFSDPLVLTTVADASGNWTYTLEDPLEAGDHEAFVAVEDDKGEVVRSASFGFSIAQAASTDENPNGLSLELTARTENNSTTIYVGAAVAVVAVALGIFLVLLRKKNKQIQRPLDSEDSSGVQE